MASPSIVNLLLTHFRKTTGAPDQRIYEVLRDWTLVPYVYRGRICGVAMMSGTEVHFVMKPECRIWAFRRQAARAFIAKLANGRPYLTTRALLSAEEDLRFLKRFGFVETHRDERVVYLILNGMPFERAHHE